jgi:hypothetical protein
MRRLIKCETRHGFHASLGRGDRCTQYKKRCGISSLLEGFGGERGVGEFTSPVILRERRPDASRPVGEGSGPRDVRAANRHRSFLSSFSSRDLFLCHPERSEGSRASARAAAVAAGRRSVRRDSSPQRRRMTQKNVSAGFCDVVAEPSPTGPSCASRSMPGNLTPNPFFRARAGKGNQE